MCQLLPHLHPRPLILAPNSFPNYIPNSSTQMSQVFENKHFQNKTHDFLLPIMLNASHFKISITQLQEDSVLGTARELDFLSPISIFLSSSLDSKRVIILYLFLKPVTFLRASSLSAYSSASYLNEKMNTIKREYMQILSLHLPIYLHLCHMLCLTSF